MIDPEALAVYSALQGGRPFVVATLDGKSPAKQRPRVGRGGHVYKPDSAEETVTSWKLRRYFPKPLAGGVCLVAVFYVPDLRTRDFDNMLKHLCDAANRIIWLDDKQVTASAQIIRLDRSNPRTEIIIGPHTGSMRG